MPGDVTSLENSRLLAREVFAFHNEIRRNPHILIPIIEEDLKYFKGDEIWRPNEIGVRTIEGPKAWHEAIAFLKTVRPAPALEWNDMLAAAATDHAYDIGPEGRIDHTGTDGSTMTKRIEWHGTWQNYIGESINVGQSAAQQILRALVVDDGVPGRGHRENTFAAKFTVVGIACAPHKYHGTCTVLDYAGAMTEKLGRPPISKEYNPGVPKDVFEMAKMREAVPSAAPSQDTGGAGTADDDEDMPPGCIEKSTKTQVTVSGKTKTTVVTTTLKFQDGSTQTKTQTTTETGP